MRLIERLIR